MNAQCKKPLVIFEFANNHMGDKGLFCRMVDEYAKIASDFKEFQFAVKLQYRDLDTFIHPAFKGKSHEGVKRFEMTEVSVKDWSDRIDYVVSSGLQIGCTPFDEVSVTNVINDDRFTFLKIGSCSFNDWPFLEKIRAEVKKKSNINLIASTGGASLHTIDKVVSFIEKSPNIQLSLMHCLAEYPSKVENQNLIWIQTLSRRYQKNVGFSSHEDGNQSHTGALAYCLGASIFEKHVVASNAESVNKYSVNPDQMKKWLEQLQFAKQSVGSEEARKNRFQTEGDYLNKFRRGVFSSKNLNKGILNNESVFMAFPASEGQLLANDWSSYSEFKLNNSVKSLEPINKENIHIKDNRSNLEKIRAFVLNLLDRNHIKVNQGADLEISHHYGIDDYDDYGLASITLVNLEYCKKFLIMKSGQSHPEQYHKVKSETFILLCGKVSLELNGECSVLNPSDVITILPGVKHSFIALQDSVIEEISSTHSSDDSFYTDTKIMDNHKRKSHISLYK